MGTSQKLSITLPRNVADEVEKLRRKNGESRSTFILRAVLEILERGRKEARARQYVEGYKKMPEGAEEVKAAEAAATALLAQEAWE